jgi:3-phosphoshikimate 1-carboxyvinyltransferase
VSSGLTCIAEENPVIETYHDHRMAMAFAVVALKRGSIIINDPMVVTKSYPGFWEDLKKAGFTIE